MRLWHQKLIPFLPKQQLLGQHRECAGMRGNGWGQKHSTVDFVWNYSHYKLYKYHTIVLMEMWKRSMDPDNKWFDPLYRGKNAEKLSEMEEIKVKEETIYPEHNQKQLIKDIKNIYQKNNKFVVPKSCIDWVWRDSFAVKYPGITKVSSRNPRRAQIKAAILDKKKLVESTWNCF